MPHVGFRMSKEMIEAVDAHARKLSSDTPGARYTRSDVLRVLLFGALRSVGEEVSEDALAEED